MKKNLFGAVAVGLALALAFTGCESGNDNALRVPTDADWAEYNKKSFSFVSNPSEYSYSGNYFASAQEYVTGDQGSWVWNSYQDGKNAWNRDLAPSNTGTLWGDIQTSRGTNVDGTKVGDVVKTKKTTVTLNTGDYTWSSVSEATNKEVFAIKNWDYTTTVIGTVTYYAAPVAEYGYASRKQVPWKTQVRGVSLAAGVPTFATYVGSDITASSVTEGLLYYGGTGYTDTEKGNIDTAIADLKKVVEAQEKYVAQLKRNEAGNATAITTAEDNLKKFKAFYANAWAQRDGAAYVVLEETTKDGLTKSVTSWVKTIGGAVVDKEESTSGTESKTEGKYKILKGNYISGTFLVTKYNKVTFNDADDKNTGTYLDEGAINHVGDIARDYPVATNTVAGKDKQYAGRVFVIENKVLRGNEAVTTSTLWPYSILTANTWKSRGNIFGWTYQTYKDAWDDGYSTRTNPEWQDAKKALVKYQGQ